MSAAADPRPAARSLALLALAAFALRLALLFVLDSPRLAEPGDPWAWGHETACLAQSLRTQDFYGDPWNQGTGPSTWLTPPFPAFTALCLELGGGVNRTSATIYFVAQSALSAATCVLLVLLGFALARPRVGWLAGALFAVYPPSLWNAVDTVWDTTAVAFGVALFAWVWVRVLASRDSKRLAAAGLVFGALVFLNPAPASLLVAAAVSGVLAWGDRLRFARGFAVFGLLALVVCLPWMLRNQRTLGTLGLRANLGVELRLGNNDTSTGRPVPFRYHPSHVAEELALYRELGEKAYAEDCGRRAFDWIESSPGRFAVLCLRRLQFFWLGDPPIFDARRAADLEARADWKAWVKFLAFSLAGLGALIALWRIDLPRPYKAFFVVALALYGAPYFLTHVSERYRFPIDPLIVWLDAWLLSRILERRKVRA
ncbi:MAG: hypothetical protein IT453_02415 [Planctomycetes bacterium]|nr:hypothetical protein [Planctomycetota bacterium]